MSSLFYLPELPLFFPGCCRQNKAQKKIEHARARAKHSLQKRSGRLIAASVATSELFGRSSPLCTYVDISLPRTREDVFGGSRVVAKVQKLLLVGWVRPLL